MIGWIRRLFRRPKLTLDLPPRTTLVVDRDDPILQGLPQPAETLAEVLADQLQERRRDAAAKLCDHTRAQLLDEEQAAAVLAARGEEMWRQPSIVAARREQLGLGEPGPVHMPTIHEVAANARAQLDEAEARIAQLQQDLRESRARASAFEHDNKMLRENVRATDAVLNSYTKTVQGAHDALRAYKVPTETRQMILTLPDQIRWLGERAKRRKKTTPRRRV